MPGDVGAAPIGVGSGRDLQIARMNAGLMTTTVMSAVVVFLAGALLAAQPSRPEAALILLSTSALGFIVATLLYANTYAWLLDPPDVVRSHSQIHRANVVSECFGVYCLLFAIPVTIVSVTGNGAVRWFVAVVTLVAIAGYQLSGASLLSHYLAQHSSRWRRAVISVIGATFTALLVGLDLSNFFGQMHITYGNFDLGRKHRKLSRRDHMRVCRAIKFGNKALLAFRGVPRAGVSHDAQPQMPKKCR